MAAVGPVEVANRVAKASRIADVLADLGCEAEDAMHLTELGWKLAARAAGTNVPSAATKACVVTALRELASTADPWTDLETAAGRQP